VARAKEQKLYLVAVDGSAPSEAATRAAIDLAGATGARLRIVTVEDLSLVRAEAIASAGMQTFSAGFEEVARDAIARAKGAVKSAGATAEFAILPVAEPAAAIVRDAESCGASLIIVGSHGRTGISRALLGSIAERVVRYAHCPVLVVR
jgi:nucleotide-binding universal stress UspA family protein